MDLSTHDTGLFGAKKKANQPVPVDDDAVDAFVAEIKGFFDEHFDDLQEGGPGLLAELPLQGDLDIVGPGLVSDTRWVEHARYAMEVGIRGKPEWARVRVTLWRDDETRVRAQFAVLPGLEIVAAELEEAP